MSGPHLVSDTIYSEIGCPAHIYPSPDLGPELNNRLVLANRIRILGQPAILSFWITKSSLWRPSGFILSYYKFLGLLLIFWSGWGLFKCIGAHLWDNDMMACKWHRCPMKSQCHLLTMVEQKDDHVYPKDCILSSLIPTFLYPNKSPKGVVLCIKLGPVKSLGIILNSSRYCSAMGRVI